MKVNFLYNRDIVFNNVQFELTKNEIKLIEFWLSKKGFKHLPTIFPINESKYIDFVAWDDAEKPRLIIGLHSECKII